MSSLSAKEESARRLSYLLRKHPVLAGKDIVLLSFPDDETCGVLVGGGSVLFQRMVNKYLGKELRRKGARVTVRQAQVFATPAKNTID